VNRIEFDDGSVQLGDGRYLPPEPPLCDLVEPGQPQCGATPPGRTWPVCARPPDGHAGLYGRHESADFCWNDRGWIEAKAPRWAGLARQMRPVGLAPERPSEALSAILRLLPAPGSATPPGSGQRGV